MAPTYFSGPVGRFVQGDLFEPNDRDANGQPLVVKTGPNAGQPRKEWFIAVAYPKNDPQTLPYLLKIAEVAKNAWPQYFGQFNPNSPPSFGATHPRFSMKIIDGDGIDDNGKSNASKDGFAGHWVVRYSTGIQAPGVWHESNLDEMARVTDPRECPRGYYVRVYAGFDGNQNDQRPGIYSNLSKVAIVRPGEIIQSGPTAAEAFGAAPTPQVQAHATPPIGAPAPAAPGGLVAVPGAAHSIEALRAGGWTDDQIVAGGYATRSAPLPATATPAPTPPASTPAPAPGAPPATPSPTSRVMLPAANGQTYEQMIAAGWTDALLVSQGMMAP